MSNDKKENKLQTVSQRFVDQVERQFTAELGESVQFTEYEKTLAQHIFLKTDEKLKDFEDKRLSKGNNKRTPFVWDNINIPKMALDAVHKVNLGLDALLPNHVHPIPYFNSKNKKYNVDLQTGYEGIHYYHIKNAIDKPKRVIYELVHKTDEFVPIKCSLSNEVEHYEFKITNAFDRGPVIGGFGYIMFEDSIKNKLILVTMKDFKDSKDRAKSDAFWNPWEDRMQYKTVVKRTCKHIPLDPQKVNAKSLAYEENQFTEKKVQRQIEENANSQSLDVDYEMAEDEPDPAPEEERTEDKPVGNDVEEPDF